jgi:hypothetical protein
MSVALWIVTGWLAIGVAVATYEYAGWSERPEGWWVGFLFVVVAWPLGFVPWERLGLD